MTHILRLLALPPIENHFESEASSILTKLASYSDSLLEALKPKWIACSIFSHVGDLSCKPMSTLVCRDAPSTLRVH